MLIYRRNSKLTFDWLLRYPVSRESENSFNAHIVTCRTVNYLYSYSIVSCLVLTFEYGMFPM